MKFTNTFIIMAGLAAALPLNDGATQNDIVIRENLERDIGSRTVPGRYEERGTPTEDTHQAINSPKGPKGAENANEKRSDATQNEMNIRENLERDIGTRTFPGKFEERGTPVEDTHQAINSPKGPKGANEKRSDATY